MQRIDLHVVSIPDHRAQLAIAQIIVGADHSISMQTAVEMAKNPPLLLFHNIDVKDAKQYVNTFERLGIAFKVSMEESASEKKEVPPESAGAPVEQAAAENPQKSAGGHRARQPMPDDPPEQGDARQSRQGPDGSPESAGTGTGQKDTAAADPQDDDGVMLEFAGIKEHNSAVDRAAAPPRAAQSGDPDHVNHPDHTAHPLHTPLYAAGSAGSAHGKPAAAGVRVGELGIGDLARIEQASRKKSLLITAGAVGVLLVLGVLMLFMPKNNKFTVTKAPIIAKKEKKPAAAKPTQTAPAAAPAQQNGDGQRGSVSNGQKQQASAYVDSAKASAGDKDNCIAFYKIAISFNRYNLPAWQGLLQAYREQGKEAEANETLENMTSIFGNEVMSITALVKPFGDLMDAYMTGDGTYRVEYRTRKLAKDDVLREVFNMTRAVRSACSCRNISIYAVTGTGKGLLAHSTQETSVHTLSAFSKQAEVVWLE